MSSPRPSRETILELLRDAQSYLKSLLEQKDPDSVLVHAWDEFYRVYDDLIRRFVLSQGVYHADVDDCVQEVWCEVVERLVDFDRPPHRPGLRAWLYTLVRSKSADLFRDKTRRPASSLDQGDIAQRPVYERELDPAALFEKNWERALLESVLEELRGEVSEVNFRILHMRLTEGCDVKQVAAELNLPAAQVRYRHHRMMRKLRIRMAVFTGEGASEAWP